MALTYQTMVMLMMKLIKDNCSIPKTDLVDISRITQKIADKTFDQLEREGILIFPTGIYHSADITKDQMIIQSVNDEYVFGNVMGFLGCENDRLVIKSRFSDENNDFLLLYMLSKVLNFPSIIDLKTDSDRKNQLFNWLIFLFPYYLKSATRKGLLKTYIRRDYNDANIKGAIDISRQIRQNLPFDGNFAYSQREYSADNDVIELVRHTIEFIKKKPYGYNLLSKVDDEVKIIVNATPRYRQCDVRKILSKNKQNPIRHAYFYEYRALQRLCTLILQYQRHQIGSGAQPIYGILFDGAWLWEEYVYTLIKDYFYHPSNKGGKGAQYLFNGRGKGLIYPDFIGNDAQYRVIADAKYKPFDNIGNKDYLQVLAYMFRFDANIGYYFYPQVNSVGDEQLRLNKGTTYENDVEIRGNIHVIKHGLKIPTNTDCYDDFVAKMCESEMEFKRVFHVFN